MDAAQSKPAKRSLGEVVKDVVLFLAAPFITLAYLAMFPFIALYLLVKGMREERARQSPSP